MDKSLSVFLIPKLFWVILGITFFQIVFMQTSLAVDYSGIGGRPAYPIKDNSRSESIFIHSIKPKESVEDGVLLLNNTDKPKTLKVYAVDSVVSSGGAFACAQEAEQKKEVGTWISLKEQQATLEAYSSKLVPFKITVPAQASSGEQNGCIVIQDSSAMAEKNSQGLSLNFRTAMRVAILVPGDITKKLSLSAFEHIDNKSSHVLKVTLKNEGTVSLDADVQLATGFLLGRPNKINQGSFTILRGQESQLNFETKKSFWGGLYYSNLTASYNGNPAIGIGQLSTNKQEVIELKSKKIWFFVAPEPKALVVELTIMLLFLGIMVKVIKSQLKIKTKKFKL